LRWSTGTDELRFALRDAVAALAYLVYALVFPERLG
jgi:hypothetical protein